MYIFELIAKLIKNKKQPKKTIASEETDYNNNCNHSFLPIDSTGNILACSKCGLITKKEDLKKSFML